MRQVDPKAVLERIQLATTVTVVPASVAVTCALAAALLSLKYELPDR
jgi:hypothetical protein